MKGQKGAILSPPSADNMQVVRIMRPVERAKRIYYRAALAAIFAVLIVPAYGRTDTDPAPGPGGGSIRVAPSSLHDFGDVIPTIGSDPFVFTVSNPGGGELEVHGIFLSDQENFVLSMEGGPNPCGSAAVIAPGGSCTFTVEYIPQEQGFFNATLLISSNDPARPELEIHLTGSATLCGC